MISQDGRRVYFEHRSVRGTGIETCLMGMDAFLLLAEQSRTWEEFRMLWFSWCARNKSELERALDLRQKKMKKRSKVVGAGG
jgi:hypothetical protein